MKATLALFAILLSLGLVSSSTIALADADDAAWIKKCVGDNKREGATPEVVAAWCSCMNNKMSSEETLRSRPGKSRNLLRSPPAIRNPAGNRSDRARRRAGCRPRQ